ncbi:hypothetical protein [Paraburkholderia rhynchosiae]|uniref:Uncharacterized protein n=1 Tax=Paraburkholderia rhynchosiae TaxID=487049 RepID=A0A2N7WDM2_9BURK|nr:hypothetical protein [Paraburkholderia rhynchosiae]PMS27508.1 hypothetical protein C0Z16_25010 [Paraburkholderia rhynchosiae]CAB3723490.1 hypothetical protein LMG27174_05156 [Paraburkholderia rhynchosiae]
MKKDTWIAIVICIVLTLVAMDGSTGLGWADYRPLRNFDYFGLGISWLLFIFVLVRDKMKGEA